MWLTESVPVEQPSRVRAANKKEKSRAIMVIKLRERGLGLNIETDSNQNFVAASHNMNGSKTRALFYGIDYGDRKVSFEESPR